jgi:hypothetical protein
VQLDDPIRQQLQGPALTSLGGRRARFSDQPCLAFGIQPGLFARTGTFIKRAEPALHEAFTGPLDGQAAGINGVGDVVVTPARSGFQ